MTPARLLRRCLAAALVAAFATALTGLDQERWLLATPWWLSLGEGVASGLAVIVLRWFAAGPAVALMTMLALWLGGIGQAYQRGLLEPSPFAFLFAIGLAVALAFQVAAWAGDDSEG